LPTPWQRGRPHPDESRPPPRGPAGITRLILDVLPARTAVISFYRRLGYTETEPSATESPIPMIYMQRPVTREDVSFHPQVLTIPPDRGGPGNVCTGDTTDYVGYKTFDQMAGELKA
jgi:hypothetical protein